MTLNAVLLLCILQSFVSCNGQNYKSAEEKSAQVLGRTIGDTVSEIGKNIRCIFQDSKNNYWFATNGEGVFKYVGNTLLQFTDKHGLCSNFVWYVRESEDGTLWLKTRDGVCSFDGLRFRTMQADERSAETSAVHSTTLLAEYYPAGESLYKFQLPHTSPITNDSNYHTPYMVYCSFKDSKGNVWFGTDSRGVCKYDGKTYTWLNDKELGVAVRSIYEDRSSNIWIGNNGYGLFVYDGKTVTNFTRQHKRENPAFLKGLKGKAGTLARVWSITEDKQGNIWIGTIDAGLWKYDGKVLVNYTTEDGLTGNAVWTVHCANDGVLWIGTDGSGITKYDGKIFTAFTGRK